MTRNFAAFILTHGRPDRQKTLRALRNHGYTGPIYLLLDDEDETQDEYRARYGEKAVLTFSKAEVAATFDEGDNTGDRRSIVYARNANWRIAAELGLTHFVQLDDDYTFFHYRINDPEGKYPSLPLRRLDACFAAMCDFLDATPAATIAMSQGGDHFDGDLADVTLFVRRKAMNSFVCRTDRPITFLGRVNEDVNTYVRLGNLGHLFLTYMPLQLSHTPTQTNKGGMTDLYRDSGTYLKSFYTVMYHPSAVTVRQMGSVNPRLHHGVNWSLTTPRILHESVRKRSRSHSTDAK